MAQLFIFPFRHLHSDIQREWCMCGNCWRSWPADPNGNGNSCVICNVKWTEYVHLIELDDSLRPFVYPYVQGFYRNRRWILCPNCWGSFDEDISGIHSRDQYKQCPDCHIVWNEPISLEKFEQKSTA